jgi:hypothetical protein
MALQDEIGKLRKEPNQEMTSKVAEMTSKLEYMTGKFKAMNDKTKHNHESIVQIQDAMAKNKIDQDSNEKTTDLIEQISTKIDYLAGKFKSLNDNVKSTNTTIHSLQDQVEQMSKEQLMQQELVQERIKENEQTLSSAMTSMRPEVVMKSVDDTYQENYGKLFVEFSDLKVAFDEMKAQQKLQSTPKSTLQEVQVLAGKIDDMKNEIDEIFVKIQNLYSGQHTTTVTPTQVVPSLLARTTDAALLSSQIEQNADEVANTREMYDRQTTTIKTIANQHGQQMELIKATPTVKRINIRGKVEPNYENGEIEVYHEARDVEEIVPDSSPIEYRDEV